MIFIGMITNIAVIEGGKVKIALWGWTIITFLGFSQIFSFYILKLRKTTRIVIGILLIILSPVLRDIIYEGKEAGDILFSLLHYIVTSPTPHLTLLPWISISFISTIFGEYIFEAMNKGTKDAYIGLFRIFFIWGIALILIGVFVPFLTGLNITDWQPGWALQTSSSIELSEYPHLRLLELTNDQDLFVIPGMPNFLLRGTSANMFYNQGSALLIISIFFYLIDIKNKSNNITKMLIYYGKVSLSLFLIHFLFIPLFIGQFGIALFLVIALTYIGFMGLFMYLWMEYARGVGSPEWLMVQFGRIGQKSGEAVKKTSMPVYKKIKKEGVERMEEFMKKLSKDDEKD